MNAATPVTAVIPLKSLQRAKQRLSPALSEAERRRLALDMFAHVVASCAAVPRIARIIVVAGDPDAARDAAAQRPITLVPDPGQGLNAAIAAADARVTTPSSLVVAADLPQVTPAELERLVVLSDGLVPAADRDAPGRGAAPGAAQADPDTAAIAGCVLAAPTTDGGTGALLRRPHDIIGPAFGASSCARHLTAGRRVGAVTGVVHLAGLAHDVDRPGDLPAGRPGRRDGRRYDCGTDAVQEA